MTAIYDFDSNTLNKTPSVWAKDTYVRDLSGKITLTKNETDDVTAALSKAGSIFRVISSTTLAEIENNPVLAQNLEQFNNTFVRKGEVVTNTASHVTNLIKWVDERFDKEIESKKSEAGKATVISKKEEYMKFFSNENKKNLKMIYDLQNAIVEAKMIIINKLDTLKKMKTFVRTNSGFRVTKQEGFAISDTIKNNVVKLVDRMEFSKNNFSADVIKGWDR
jgi:hypothetical protein